MKKLMWLTLFLILAALGGLLALSLTSEPPKNLGPTADGKLQSCPDKPNCVCSYDTDAEHAIEPFQMKSDAALEMKLLEKLVTDHPQAKVITSADGYLHAEFTSRLFRYVDDVEFLADTDANVIHVRSASRAGHSDLGVNRKRIRVLQIQFEAQSDRDIEADSEAVGDEKQQAVAPVVEADGPRQTPGYGTFDEGDVIPSKQNRQVPDGAPRAHADIAAGKLILRGQPLPNPPWWNKYTDLMESECGIKLEVVKHADAKLTDADNEYNTVMQTEIERRFGDGIIGKLKTKSQQE